MKFTLEVQFGNDAMSTGADLSWALGRLAGRLEDSYDPIGPSDGIVMDINGNTVGRWVIA